MLGSRPIALAVSTVVAVACYSPRRVPFLNSSLDANAGQPHTVLLAGADTDDVTNALVERFASRGLDATYKDCVGPVCYLVLVTGGKDPAVAMQQQQTDAYGRLLDTQPGQQEWSVTKSGPSEFDRQSKFWVRIAEAPGGALVMAVGVPILEGDQACPPYVARYLEACQPPELTTDGDTPLAETIRGTKGHDVSGAVEAEIIRSVFAELR